MSRFIGRLNFNFPTTTKQFGFSEVYFINAADGTACAVVLDQIGTNRLALLPAEVELVGALISDTDVKGDSWPTGFNFPEIGTWAALGVDPPEQPYLSLRYKLFGGTLKRGARFLHGLPKSQIAAGGVFVPTAPFTTALNAFWTYVVANCCIGTKIPGATAPPFYTFTPYTSFTQIALEKKNIGRPFGLPVGRRLIA